MNWKWVSEMPSTNVRIAASILMALATGTRVIVLGWDPSAQWLGFLIIWAGLDVAQFASKRSTDSEYMAAKQGVVAPSGDPPKQPEIGV